MIPDTHEIHHYRGRCPVHGLQTITCRERLERVPCMVCDRDCEPIDPDADEDEMEGDAHGPS